jgi:hypothetical protein
MDGKMTVIKCQYHVILVGENEYCVWDWDIAKQNIEFLDSIDSNYFEFVADLLAPYLLSIYSPNNQSTLERRIRFYNRTRKNKIHKKIDLQHAAIQLRTEYSHALETLFSLLIATIQSPLCSYAWVRLYRPSQLRKILKKIQDFERIPTYWTKDYISWQKISSVVHQYLKFEDKEKENSLIKNFGSFWQRLAREFISEDFTEEYNSIKHGLRIRSGGFSFAFGKQDARGVRVKSKNMHLLGRSDFGSSFLTFRKLGEKSPHYQFSRRYRNWNPESMLLSLRLISVSINNIISNLLVSSGKDPKEVEFSWPVDSKIFQKPSRLMRKVGVTSMIYNCKIRSMPHSDSGVRRTVIPEHAAQ